MYNLHIHISFHTHALINTRVVQWLHVLYKLLTNLQVSIISLVNVTFPILDTYMYMHEWSTFLLPGCVIRKYSKKQFLEK